MSGPRDIFGSIALGAKQISSFEMGLKMKEAERESARRCNSAGEKQEPDLDSLKIKPADTKCLLKNLVLCEFCS